MYLDADFFAKVARIYIKKLQMNLDETLLKLAFHHIKKIESQDFRDIILNLVQNLLFQHKDTVL